MEQVICDDCGPASVNHFVERWAVLIERLIKPFTGMLEIIWRATGPFVLMLPFAQAALPFTQALTMLRLGTLKDRPDHRDSLRTLALWEAAEVRQIELLEFRFFDRQELNFFIARHGGRTRVFDMLPRPNKIWSKALDWIDDKGAMKRHFLAHGIPVAEGRSVFSYKEARKVFHEIGPHVIVKPAIGSRSRHTTVHIASEAQLELAFGKAKILSPWVMVEKELTGMVHRVTTVGGRVVGVIRREPPHVIGDGVSTVRQLVVYANADPRRRGPIFHELPWDKDVDMELQKQKLTRDSVPEKGRMVVLYEKVSRSFGATTTDLTDVTHPANIALFEKIASTVDDPLLGIDFMIEDMSKAWTDQPTSGVIEVNSMPFLDLHHYPYEGKARDAAGALWDLVFPGTALPSSTAGRSQGPRN
jgi:D-alanine-D-alanine ligase-like ATP-grasp enzyme